MAGQLERITVKIANGATLSGVLDLSARRVVAIQAPAAWTAGTLSFAASASIVATAAESGPTATQVAAPPFVNMVDDANGAIVIAAAAMIVADNYIALTGAEREALASVRYLRLRAGAAQGADRFLFVICEPRGV